MAGITHLKEFQKPALLGLVDETLRQQEPTLGDRYLPDLNVYSTSFAYDVIKTSQHIGALIGYGAEPPVVDRDAVARVSGDIVKIGLKYVATEEELLAINQARNNNEFAATVERLLVKGVNLVQAVRRRATVMKMEALTKGKISYNRNGVKVELDYGIPANHKVALTAPNDWTDTTRDVIGDLIAWVKTYEETNGRSPDEILISREVQAYLLKNQNVIIEAGRQSGTPRVSAAELNAVLEGFELPPVRVVKETSVTVKDIYTGQTEVIEFFPKNRVVMLAEGVGNFLYGPTVENDFEPGIALMAYDKQEPIESVIKAVAAGLPVIEQPGLIFHADVIPAQ